MLLDRSSRWFRVGLDRYLLHRQGEQRRVSEAINSMYMWYSKADVCYVYLSDVDEASHWKHSRWFTRGWTLQELIAPSSVIFFDRDWEEVGTKLSLHKAISGVTRIPSEALLGECRLTYCSVAQRMSWAARRKTTRSEDLAYCLLGLFRVSMPLLYGEGLEKAFVRLQIEILRNEVDTSMFAWESNSGCATLYATGLLATSPSAFYNSGDVRGLSVFMSADYPSITVTPRGVNLRTEIMGSVPAIASVGTRRSDGKCSPSASSWKCMHVGTATSGYIKNGTVEGPTELLLTRCGGAIGFEIPSWWFGKRLHLIIPLPFSLTSLSFPFSKASQNSSLSRACMTERAIPSKDLMPMGGI